VDFDALTAVVTVVVSLFTLIGAIRITQIVVQALGRGRSARTILERRLARGEIDTEEFYELESALRSSEPARQRRPRRLLRS
jgi:uncharacterized membrane protein